MHGGNGGNRAVRARGEGRGEGQRGTVVTYGGRLLPPDGHERATHAAVARHVADVLGFDFGGEHDGRRVPGSARYVVPSETLTTEEALALDVRTHADLFGGVVPHPFVGTKTITHPLLDDAETAPAGWSQAFPAAVAGDVLAGYSAFGAQDAARAALRLLEHGPVRLKRATGIGGTGQVVLADRKAVEVAVAALDEAELARYGCVMEEDLADVATCSVGRVEIGVLVAAYCGTQRLTTNRHGAAVYGGSDLLVARGDFDALDALSLEPGLRLAVGQARRYDAAADRCFAGFFASRRNYDVAQGTRADGSRRSGVLEQSWRIGGASGAELAALRAFAADPALRAVRARSVEVHGECEVPPHALRLFDGVDARVGRLVKYATVEPHDRS